MELYLRSDNPSKPERCIHIVTKNDPTPEQLKILQWLVGDPETRVSLEPRRRARPVTRIGPRIAVETSFSTRAREICARVGIEAERIEMSTLYVGDPAHIVKAHLDAMTQEVYPEHVTFDQAAARVPLVRFPLGSDPLEALRAVNKKYEFGIKDHLLPFVLEVCEGREPNDALLGWISNALSEHCEHPTIKAQCLIDGVIQPSSIMELVQQPWKLHPGNSLVAFHDGAGVLRGKTTQQLLQVDPGGPSLYRLYQMLIHYTLSAETHNHPCHISPLEGAKTGIGGQLRDLIIQGLGALFLGISGSGFCTGNLFLRNYKIAGEVVGGEESDHYASALFALIEMVKGVCSYGNEIGRPNVFGFVRSFEQIVDGVRRGWVKPICYSAGTARVADGHVFKRPLEKGMLIIGMGGRARRIGVGGGSASSSDGRSASSKRDFASVQRGDAIAQAVLFETIHGLVALGEDNPIVFIDDQGAGGVGNLVYELVGELGGKVNLLNVNSADPTLSPKEILIGEYQERVAIVIRASGLPVLEKFCKREGTEFEVLGEITGDGRFVVDSAEGNVVDVSLDVMHGAKPRPQNVWTRVHKKLRPFELPRHLSLARAVRMMFQQTAVGSKAYITRIGDRSVSGLVAQQQCCGPQQLPVSDVAVMADSFYGLTGTAQCLGEQPIKGLIDPKAQGELSVAELLTNMCSALITEIPDIKCRVNEMLALSHEGEGAHFYDAIQATCEVIKHFKFAANGGKDSLSMKTKLDSGEIVVAPGQVVVFGTAPMDDITKVVTPDLAGGGVLMLLDVGAGKCRMGGSAIAQACNELGDDVPRVDSFPLLDRVLTATQQMIREDLITAYHDRSDGGLITTLIEMAIAGDRGATIRVPITGDSRPFFLNEEVGIVVEIPDQHVRRVREIIRDLGLAKDCHVLGNTHKRRGGRFKVHADAGVVLNRSVRQLHRWWQRTSDRIEFEKSTPKTVRAEIRSYAVNTGIPYRLTFEPSMPAISALRPKVGLIRASGSNGVREMAAMWHMAGFDVVNIHMNDILNGTVTSFDEFAILSYPGGFADGDVLGSAKGWAAPVVFDPRIRELFLRFYARTDVLSVGICNGCQFLGLTGLIKIPGIADADLPRLLPNDSQRFEVRWSGMFIPKSRALVMQGMEGSILGIHSAHGEGRFGIANQIVLDALRHNEQIVGQYVDHTGTPTDLYPYCPNGSPLGIAGICSPGGEHMMIMPHFERAFLPWQWHERPAFLKNAEVSPWMQIAHNARALFK